MVDPLRRVPIRWKRHSVRIHLALWAALGSMLMLQAFRLPLASLSAWTPVVEGIDFRAYSLPQPNRVFVARMDLARPDLILDTAAAYGTMGQAKETVGSMAGRADGSLNAWGGEWGARSRVVAAINGSGFDLHSGIPFGGQIQSGWMVHRYDALAGSSGVVWTADRQAWLGGCIQYEGWPLTAIHSETGERFEIDALNTRRDDEGLWLYTPHFAPALPEGSGRVLVRVEVPRPLAPQASAGASPGIVDALADGRNRFDIPFGHVVLSAEGSGPERFLRLFHPGDAVEITSQLVDLEVDCEGRSGRSWRQAYAALGGDFVFLVRGEVRTSDELGPNTRDPRTSICFDDRYLHFVVVDGRLTGWSVGMTLEEMAAFCRDELGATWGINQDGGGSTAMWVDGEVRNRPSDGAQRAVANAWLMIALEPAERSRLFEEGFRVLAPGQAALHTGPGAEFPEAASIPAGAQVTIDPVLARVQGIFARGSYWWKVSLEDQEGWVSQDALVSPGRSLATFTIPRPAGRAGLSQRVER